MESDGMVMAPKIFIVEAMYVFTDGLTMDKWIKKMDKANMSLC